ncbi:MAG: OmpA family protein [Bryobacteraceae bacterium]
MIYKTMMAVGAGAVLMFATTGCATKKHVRSVVAPVEARVGDLETKSAEHASTLSQLEREVAQADEHAMAADRKAMAADQKAVAAGQEASRAQQTAMQAGERADAAREVADKGIRRIGDLERVVDVHRYQLVMNENVLFGFDRSRLTPEAKQQIDEAVRSLSGVPNYIIEVQGYTDRTGSSEYNLELSRRRANAVVRYLTTAHQVPLRRIHVLGVGMVEEPARSAEARRQSRRVELKVFAPEGTDVRSTGVQATPSAKAGL